MHAILYLFVPYIVLVITNAALIAFLASHQKKNKAAITNITTGTVTANKKGNANKLIIAITLLFIVMTLPGAVDDIMFDTWIQQEWGFIVVLLCNACDFTYHALSFPILMLTNVRFRKAFFALLDDIGLAKKPDVRATTLSQFT